MEVFGYDIWTLLVETKIAKLIIGAVVLFIAVFIVRKLISSFFKRTDFLEERKERTLESMLNSIISYTATIGFILYGLTVFEVPVGNLLAGAGILGIIIGFGAQSLIQDFLAGLFLLYEKQLHKGDYVTVNNTHHGTVEDIGLRFLKVRQWSGRLMTIRNGEIKTIENYNFEHMRVIEDITTNFHEDPRRIMEILTDACVRLNDELGQFLKKDLAGKPLEPFQLYGLGSLNDQYRGYQYTVTGLVEDLVYWTAAKETRRILAEILYDNGIQMAEQRVEVKSATPKERE
ncbi:mechanosensitive ion channel family protein [Thalassobacillus pellis]|uniref:mechanosensitive ion channel family protein n=1 Tax=Thalassobacillus pellis TaxID=748008 RepID=UPI0019622692|nr:mechanosensitive ion channel family protein [Thalassobacillus pellis]MBM7553708.1 small conductance mechanosensitive channel [Thalassobacillus pellis]